MLSCGSVKVLSWEHQKQTCNIRELKNWQDSQNQWERLKDSQNPESEASLQSFSKNRFARHPHDTMAHPFPKQTWCVQEVLKVQWLTGAVNHINALNTSPLILSTFAR